MRASVGSLTLCACLKLLEPDDLHKNSRKPLILRGMQLLILKLQTSQT